ncbi:MAG: hypothetical protein H7Z21_14145 [Hymenobacter sp.]|nr:hypothetical protein [Hymenobacter sp.]
MRRIILVACAAGLSWGLAGCAPSYLLAIQPAWPDTPGEKSQSAVFDKYIDSVEVAVGFVRYEKTELIFQVEVINDSHQAVVVAPETFYYIPLDTSAVVASTTAALPIRVDALAPEQYLRKLTDQLNEQVAKSEKVGFLEILTTVTHVVEDVSSIKKQETDAQIAERDQRHQDENAAFDGLRETHAGQADQIYDQRQIVERFLLRRDTLRTGQRALGYVHFPRTDAANRLRLVIFFNERPIPFDFTQQRGK